MEIPNYDFNKDEYTNFKQLYPYMPKSTFRMLICGNSGSGKTNLLYHILMRPLVCPHANDNIDDSQPFDMEAWKKKQLDICKQIQESNDSGVRQRTQ